MGNESNHTIEFSTGKPTPWWQKSPVVSVIVAAAAALVFGLWSYVSNSTTAPEAGVASSR
jgi:hypothetical protein